MISKFRTEEKALRERILEETVDYDYRCVRYQVGYSVALAYTPEVLPDFSMICSQIRKSDRYIPLSDHFHAVVFDFTDEEKGIKAANKLLTYFQHAYFSKSVYAAVVNCEDFPTSKAMMAKLFYLLEYAIRHRMDNHVMDKSQLIG